MDTKEKLARFYIGMSENVNIDEEERYYNHRIKEYDAFKRGYEAAESIAQENLKKKQNEIDSWSGFCG